MNIFFLDTNPSIAAQSMVDRHVVKMILETAQILSTAHRVCDGIEQVVDNGVRKKKVYKLSSTLDEVLYNATHVNHPCSVWARESTANYAWLYNHLVALSVEYTWRYGKIHATENRMMASLWFSPTNMKTSHIITKPPSCMAPEFILGDDVVENYRNYYNYGKTQLLRWTGRKPPKWIVGKIVEASDKPIYTISR